MAPKTLGFALVLALTTSALAHAQAPASSAAPNVAASGPYPACTKQPSRGDVEAAHYAYLTGRHSFDEGDYATALTYFKDAYRRDCTKHELLPIIARAYELSQNRAEALVALETFLKRVPPTDPNVDAVKKRIANLKAQGEKSGAAAAATGTGTGAGAASTPSATTTPPSNTTSPSPAPATAPAATPPATSDSAAAPSTPATTPPSEHKTSVAPFIAMGAGVAVAAVGTIVLVGGLQQRTDATNECPNRDPVTGKLSCASPDRANEVQRNYDAGTTQAYVGGVLVGVGGVAIVGGVVWYVLDRNASSSTAALTPWLGPGLAGASFAQRF